jgi:hypothetical protein
MIVHNKKQIAKQKNSGIAISQNNKSGIEWPKKKPKDKPMNKSNEIMNMANKLRFLQRFKEHRVIWRTMNQNGRLELPS